MPSVSKLRQIRLTELLNNERLPSGASYVLKPDTVENGLKVSEANDPLKWRQKALEVLAIVESVNGIVPKGNGGVDFIANMLDTDVVFLSLAWTFSVNGSVTKFSRGTPCPECKEPITEVDVGELMMNVRDNVVSGVESMFEIEVDPALMAKLPGALASGKFMVKDPTWRDARARVPDASMSNLEVVDINRAMTALMVKSEGHPPRSVTLAESRKFPMKIIQEVLREMDLVIPNFAYVVHFRCSSCEVEIDLPFARTVD